MTGYTHVISFYQKSRLSGWVFDTFKTTKDAVPLHLHSLYKKQVDGKVRQISVDKLR